MDGRGKKDGEEEEVALEYAVFNRRANEEAIEKWIAGFWGEESRI